jgi:hypothetical protein
MQCKDWLVKVFLFKQDISVFSVTKEGRGALP